MAILHQKTWGRTQREWGYEIRVDFVDSVTGQVRNETLTFESEPTAAELGAVIAAKADKLTTIVAAQSIEVVNEDGTKNSY